MLESMRQKFVDLPDLQRFGFRSEADAIAFLHFYKKYDFLVNTSTSTENIENSSHSLEDIHVISTMNAHKVDKLERMMKIQVGMISELLSSAAVNQNAKRSPPLTQYQAESDCTTMH